MARLWRMLARGGIAAVLVVAVWATGVQGAEGPPEDFRISGPGADGDDWEPAVAWNYSNDEFLVVWADWRNHDTKLTDIFGQRVSADGALLGPNFRISGPGALAYDLDAAVAWNDISREYLVVWSDGRTFETRGGDIYGQRVSAGGDLVGANFRVTGAGALLEDHNPAIAWNSVANEYLVAWEDLRNIDTRSWDVYARRLSATGERLGADVRISGPRATGIESHPEVAWNGVDEFLIVWGDQRNAGSRGGDIYGQRVSGSADRIGSNFRVSGPGATADEIEPAVAWNGWSGEYLVVWGDGRQRETRGNDIFGQRLSVAGAALGANFRVVGTNADTEDRLADVVWNNSTRQYLVVWEDERNEAARGADVFGQRVSVSGARVGPDFQVSGPGAVADDGYPAVAWNDNANRYLVVYEDDRGGHDRQMDIYGQFVAG